MPSLKAAIVQDANDGRVLMLAWMDEEAERLTRETGEAWFWSRSRERLWKKGETSGNVLRVVEIREDCDDDALLLRVEPAGPACHTGSRSCFAPDLWRTVVERVRERPEGSYVASLADEGVAKAAQKLVEEAGEAADVLFHLYVLLAVAGVDVDDVEAELVSRRR
jgi:phosphoribosyl-ATP pyrophosphohydrolase/phosphoribosyl-AMP cyclohydrolase